MDSKSNKPVFVIQLGLPADSVDQFYWRDFEDISHLHEEGRAQRFNRRKRSLPLAYNLRLVKKSLEVIA